MKVVTVFPSFANKGGAEDMAISIAKGLNGNNISPFLQQDKTIYKEYQQDNLKFEKLNFRTILKYHRKGYIFISHHRKITTYLVLLSRFLLGNKLRVIHVAHNTFSNLKYLTLFPKFNIAVSNTVKDNMISYFGLKEEDVRIIYNGLEDKGKELIEIKEANEIDLKGGSGIKILFLGRITPVKRQIEFVKATKGKLNRNVTVYFGGIGEDMESLKIAIDHDRQYIPLGLININEDLNKYDYVCLFSEKEGLPLSLIQGQMFAKPLITNDIPQVKEINIHNYSGFVNHSWEDIINCINNLPKPSSEEYQQLSKNSRAVFEQKFNYASMVEHYRSFIKSIKWNKL